MKILKSLEEHNKQASNYHWALVSNQPHPNGIACPECGEELRDADPNMILASMPPKKSIYCPSCKYTGYRIV
jgi:uncharacterized protein with PIN domain